LRIALISKDRILTDFTGLDLLSEALRAADDERAFSLFRELVARAPADPALMSALEHVWASFIPDEDRSDWRQQIQSARFDELAARLLLARAAYGLGHPAGAIRIVRGAGQRAPRDAAPVFLLCAMLLKSGDPEANQLLSHCLAQFPDFAPGWNILGNVLLERGKTEAALVCFAQGQPNFASVLRRGLVLRDLGRRTEAEAAFEAAVALDATSARAWFLLGTCRQDRADFTGAASAYRAVLARDGKVAEAAVNLGMVLQESGDLTGAKAAYGHAIAARADTFGRIAQALTTAPKGELWLDLVSLRRNLAS
jgi:tetratricopeptide (TPR) repeat protein